MKYPLLFSLFAVIIIVSVSCRKEEAPQPDPSELIKHMDELVVSDQFDWRTSNEVEFRIATRNASNDPIPHVKIDIYLTLTIADDGSLSGELLLSGFTDADGRLVVGASLPRLVSQVWVTTRYLGLPGETAVPVQGNIVEVVVGGPAAAGALKSAVVGNAWPNFSYLGTFNSNGVPNYLAGTEVVSASFLADINATFPEYQPVPTYHPQYLASGNETNTVLTEPAEVWVVFVHEGAGWKNSLGFYTYPSGSPPATPADIQNITILFPNLSFPYLASGMKVKLGEFPAGTEIGWVLMANGWVNGNVTTGTHMIYSDSELNPATDPAKKQQFVQVYDPGRDIVLLGIEDIKRQTGGDNDFNDAMFYVLSNPIVAVQTNNMPVVTYTATDTDNDGVSDNFDEYPTDPARAFNQYYPSQNSYATLGFEDYWPETGDYDFNDVVVKYRYKQVKNADNYIVNLEGTYILAATGATYRNGFGVQLPVNQSVVSEVSGTFLTGSLIQNRANGTELGQTQATVIVFSNSSELLEYPGSGVGVNTTPGAPWVEPTPLAVNITFTTPQAASDLGSPPFNPFIFVNQERGREIHLPNAAPTQLADNAFFGTYDDNSLPATGRYYKTITNLPWAINILDGFDYPNEQSEITGAYLKFGQWAESIGQQYYDWYVDQPGYRNVQKIY